MNTPNDSSSFLTNNLDAEADHIGWRLWSAAAAWKERYARAMIDAGHHWYAEARSSVVPHIGDGAKQSTLVRRMGLTKQAVQQLVDDLEKVGIVERVPDPDDRRGKIVRFTDKGLAARRDAALVKARIEAEIRAELGDDAFETLDALLKRIPPIVSVPDR